MNNITPTNLERCHKLGCHATATHSVRLMFAAKGEPRDTTKRFGVNTSLKLCRAHAHSAKAKDIVTNDLKDMLTAMTASIGAQRPFDFNNVIAEPIALDDTEWVQFEAMQRKKN